ncbi:MAG: lysoplasmalogenase family protein [Chitinophagaceae bacterium]
MKKWKIPKKYFKMLFITLFWVAVIAEGYFLYTRQYNLRLLSRTFFMPLLILTFLLQIISRNHLLLLGAAIFGWLGDVLTIQWNQKLQWYGFAAYGIHLLVYIWLFLRFQKFTWRTAWFPVVFWLIVYLIFVGIIHYIVGYRIDVVSKIAVAAFGFVVCLYAVTAFQSGIYYKDYSFHFAIVAALAVVISLSLFVFNTFYFKRLQTWPDVVTATLYALANWLIIKKVMYIERQILHKADMKDLSEFAEE